MANNKHDRFLQLIAIFKFLKAILFILAALGAFGLMQEGIGNRAREWGAALAFGSGQRIVRHIVMQILALSRSKIAALGVVALVYAALFLTEGIGLWRERRWAEYLTVIITGSLIPVEIYEIAHHLTLLRIATFIVNIAVVIYLIVRLRAPRHTANAERVPSVPPGARPGPSTAG
jgi:uncharacterized membrane protein (DUF2068 family)